MFSHPLDRAERQDLARALKPRRAAHEIIAFAALFLACAALGISVTVLLHVAGLF